MQMYKHVVVKTDSHIIFKWIWKCANRIRHKIFFWLVLHDIINTTSLLKRKEFHMESYNVFFAMIK